jgi:hypothetical protein
MEQPVVVRFLALKKLSANDVKAELEGEYGHDALSPSAVKKWRKRFANERPTSEKTQGLENLNKGIPAS